MENRPQPDAGAESLSVSEQIRQRLGSLSPSERRVARTLLAGPPTIGLESSARLAQHAGVSVPTVSRFIAGLGFGSYAEFQRTLHAEISARIMPPAEVYRLHQPEALLREFDMYEACGEGFAEPTQYVRQMLPVTLEEGRGEAMEVWTYIYNWPVAHLTRIASGRFMEK